MASHPVHSLTESSQSKPISLLSSSRQILQDTQPSQHLESPSPAIASALTGATANSFTNSFLQLLMQQQLQHQIQLQLQQLQQEQLFQQRAAQAQLEQQQDDVTQQVMDHFMQSLIPLVQAQMATENRSLQKPQTPSPWQDPLSSLPSLAAIKLITDAVNNTMGNVAGQDTLQQQPLLDKLHLPDLINLAAPAVGMNTLPSSFSLQGLSTFPNKSQPFRYSFPDASPKGHSGPYVQKACQACKLAHTACGNERPCQRCIRNNKTHECVDASRRKRGRPSNVERAFRQQNTQSLSKLEPLVLSGSQSVESSTTMTILPHTASILETVKITTPIPVALSPFGPTTTTSVAAIEDIPSSTDSQTENSESPTPAVQALKRKRLQKLTKPSRSSKYSTAAHSRAHSASKHSNKASTGASTQRQILPFLPPSQHTDLQSFYQKLLVPSTAQPTVSNEILQAIATLAVLLPGGNATTAPDYGAITAAILASVPPQPQLALGNMNPSQLASALHQPSLSIPAQNHQHSSQSSADLRHLLHNCLIPPLQPSNFDTVIPTSQPRGNAVPEAATAAVDPALMALFQTHIAAALQQTGLFDAVGGKPNSLSDT
ncbi:hypothetical protein QVD99_005417 [Batrachochytrium dendrobatidis]|nr:hypothetical protein QVD99_005417 [Batrachochytrium dendrobatidis]